ncbi:hypothetical protein ACJW31_02G015400 [Castanea mollissima]
MVTFIEGNGRPGTIKKTTKAVNPVGGSIRTSSHVNRISTTNIINCSTTNIVNSSTKSINNRNSSTNIRISSTNIVNSSSIRISSTNRNNNIGSHHHHHHSTPTGNHGIKAIGHSKTVEKHSHHQSNKVVVTHVDQKKKTQYIKKK